MSIVLGIIFGGIVLFTVCSWFSAKNPAVKDFWERMEERYTQPKGKLKVFLNPDGQPSFEFHPDRSFPVSDKPSWELEIPVTRWTVKPK